MPFTRSSRGIAQTTSRAVSRISTQVAALSSGGDMHDEHSSEQPPAFPDAERRSSGLVPGFPPPKILHAEEGEEDEDEDDYATDRESHPLAETHSRRKGDKVSYTDRIQLSGELFEAVQQSRVFPDSKQYVDMLSLLLPDTVISKWKEEKDNPDFDLRNFISENFELPKARGESVEIHPKDRCREHVQELWPMLFREADDSSVPHSSLIPLPYPYVVPGGRFREIYYWDSYFTAHGLIADGHEDMALNMAKNFRHVIHNYGHIPNGNRFYYMSRSQPPFFVPLVALLADVIDTHIESDFYKDALLEHSFWMDATGDPNRRAVSFTDRQGRKHRLNRYWDDNPVPREESWIEDKLEFEASNGTDAAAFYRNVRAACESGWDFSSRWLADMSNLTTIETTSILPVDLNTVLWFNEMKLAEWSQSLGHPSRARELFKRADRRKKAINQLMWDDSRGFYFDYHLERKERKETFSLAAVYPLYFNLTDQSQAEAIAEQLEKHFLKDGGLQTTTVTSGQQWDAPNGWAPLQWMAIVGLEGYGMTELAEKIRMRWLKLNEDIYKKTGKMVEKYNVVDLQQEGGGGEYPLQDGFGWTNGVFSALSTRLDEKVVEIIEDE